VNEQLVRCAAGQRKYIRLYRNRGKLALAAMYLRRARIVGRSFAAGAPPLTHVCTVGACGTKPRRGPLAALPGAGVWRRAWGDGAHCPSTARHAAFNYQKFYSTQATRSSKALWNRFKQKISKLQMDSKWELGSKGGSTPPVTSHHRIPHFAFSPAAKSSESPCGVATFLVNSEPHTAHRGTSLGPLVCGGNYFRF
jgi:hypothetical protein